MAIMEVQYVYCKSRQQFGRQCKFDFDGPLAIENIEPSPELRNEFILKNPCHVTSQKSQIYAVHEAQTDNTKTTERGMVHCEGGWPRGLDFREEETTGRYRKRIIRSENWVPAMKNLMTPMEHCVKQNNAVNIYENYFDEMIPSKLVLPIASRAVNTYEDPQLNARPISNISWSRRGTKMIVSHCSMEFQRAPPGLSPVSYLWSIENPVHPLVTLKPKTPSVTIEFSPRHSSLLVSGQMTGQVAFWDLRTAEFPVAESHRLYSHSDPASIVLWIDTATHCEFASASTDGLMKWWDIRKIQEPQQTLAMDLSYPKFTEMITSVGISSMNCSSGTVGKFIVGLENGVVINGSLKTKNAAEKLGGKFKCHCGPVNSVHRNPFISKIFMTVGDSTIRIWAEDMRENCLASTEYRSKNDMLTAGCWSSSRVSVFYGIRSTGELEVWDLLSGLNKPVEMLKLGKDPLTHIKPNENGKFIAIGNQIGKVYLVESSGALTTNRKNDKAILTAYFESCKRYEKSVDNRLREMRYTRRHESQEDSEKNDTIKRKLVITNLDKDKVRIDVNQDVNRKPGGKVKNARSVPLDFDLIEPENEYFALVRKELKRYNKDAICEDDSGGILESEIEDNWQGVHHGVHHGAHHHHHRKSYRNKKNRKKYKNTEAEASFMGPDSPEVSKERIEEVIKPNLASPKLTKSRKRSPKACVVRDPSRICRPDICCRDLKDSSKKGMKFAVKIRGLLNENKEILPRKTKASSFSIADEKVPDDPVQEIFPATIPIAEKVQGLRSTRFEKYHTSVTPEVKDISEEVKAQILTLSTARPSAILIEASLAKERIDQEAERIRSPARKGSSGVKDKTRVTESVVQTVIELAEEKIDSEDTNAVYKTEDVEPRSSPTVRSTQGSKMRQQKLSPKPWMTTSSVLPRRALIALQVTPTEVIKQLPKLTEREYYFSQKDSCEDRMYPGSSAFPPLPRIVLPKLLDRPPDPTAVVGHEESGNGKKVKRKLRSGDNKVEKSRSPNN